MLSYIATFLAASASLVSAIPIEGRSQGIMVTPHAQYSSSIGVVGCKINTNRVAYWPGAVDCNNICVKVNYEGRSVFLLKIDTSGGAYDISYDAWNYLVSGKSCTESPQQGGETPMTFENVGPEQCAHLLDDGKVPLTASNSMNFVSFCLGQPNSFVAQNHKLYNILDPVCHWGKDETCSLDLNVSNQPSCPSGLGSNVALDLPVWNYEYGTGNKVVA